MQTAFMFCLGIRDHFRADPYVKASLMFRGRRVKKRKTSVRHATLAPVYNEGLVFDVPMENIQDASLIVKVIDHDRCAMLLKS